MSNAHSGSRQSAGVRIYNLFPLLAGSTRQWADHLPRIAEMGFNWVYVNPFHYPGFSGSLYAVKDYYRLHPMFQGGSRRSPDSLLGEFLRAADKAGLRVMMDLVVNHTGKDSPLVDEHPEWYARDPDGSVRSPFAIDPANANRKTVWGDLAEIDYGERPEREGIVQYWRELVRHYVKLGFAGFRCDAAYKVPAAVWAHVIAAAREQSVGVLFAAETLGCRLEEVEQLHTAGFDYLFNSAKWWDFKADWLLEQYRDFRHIAPSIAFPESHDTPRLATELAQRGIRKPAEVQAAYKQRYAFTAAFSTGLLMPMGFEFGFRRKLDVVKTQPNDWEDPQFDLSDYIAAVNAAKAAAPALNEEGPQHRLSNAENPIVALLRETEDGAAWALTLVNTSGAAQAFPLAALGDTASRLPTAREVTPHGGEAPAPEAHTWRLAAWACRVFAGGAEGDPSMSPSGARTLPSNDIPSDIRSRAIIIQSVYPELDGGRYPVKREVGDALEVWADIFKEGHDTLAAVVQYRPREEAEWREVKMEYVNNDRWRGAFPLERNTRYHYTIEAWTDHFESWRNEVQKKRQAGDTIALELEEGRCLVVAALERAPSDERQRLQHILDSFGATTVADERADLLLSSMVRTVMARWPDRSAAVRYDQTLEVIVDRVEARFAAWYEMFHRSQGTAPGKWATFQDCERRLPELQALGFDVLYLLPVHPIGRVHRKGPNNSPVCGPEDPGSPYAIGSDEGGHTAVHPELGTLEDFRALVHAAHKHGMEVALDFAIQCAPDHPWVKEHPEWFLFRPDGSIKHAENPPKKYQDIVNVNFYGPHRRELWQALLDVVLFWVRQGVKIFRVDNPHTKPVPFWEWLIREVQLEHPDVIFLSEAFTRPKMLQMLAKVGFAQSYTYFTWRNFRDELTAYMTELTQTNVKEYLRPHFFTNTPDILPGFLQTGGRPAFRIRLVLAATLSSLYGIYNGFELCENAAIPGTEEYLNSEKYEFKVWDWDRPGNIKADIATINRIRRENPALHEFENLRFYPADEENVLFYGKMTPDRSNIIFVAVNLDPFDTREATIEFPLDAMGIPHHETFEVEELLTGAKHLWRGPTQRIRLNPEDHPAAIYRITAWERIDYREPCF